jgi:hypothetical protein
MISNIVAYTLLIMIVVIILHVGFIKTSKYKSENFGIIQPVINPYNLNTTSLQDQFILGADIGNNTVGINTNRKIITDKISFQGTDITENISHNELEKIDPDFNPNKIIWNMIGKAKSPEKQEVFSNKDITTYQNNVFGFNNKINHNTSNEGLDAVDKLNEQTIIYGNEAAMEGLTISKIYDNLTNRH